MMNEVDWARLIIRVVVGIVMIIFGLHQLARPQSWSEYLPPSFARVLPVPVNRFMRTHGLGNFVLGILFTFGIFQPWILWLVLLWWVSILPFAYYSDWGVGLRDTAIIAAIIAVVILS
jgi:cytochrome c biogenesis protein CcdA